MYRAERREARGDASEAERATGQIEMERPAAPPAGWLQHLAEA